MSKKLRWVLCAGLLILSGGAVDAYSTMGMSTPPSASDSVVRMAILRLVPSAQIQEIIPAPMPGFYQVIASGHLVYVSADGKYVINGDLIDAGQGTSLRDEAWAKYSKAELAKVPLADRIVFAPPHPKYTVTVFTDVTCPYCRVLHEEIAAINKEGIAVQYLAWPRSGVTDDDGKPTDTYNEMVSVWCAADRNSAFTAAKQGHDPKPATCKNPVKAQFDLGLRLGVGEKGTPAVYAEDGTLIGGFLTPEQMLDAVKQHSDTGS